MVFMLEALDADHGDALLLHYGADDSPDLIVIDGGPSGVYQKSLKKRLDEIRDQRGVIEGQPLPIRMLMVSHIDDDHINGVLDLFEELVEARDNKEPLPYRIASLWFNSFDDIVGKNSTAMVAAVSASDSPSAHAAGSWQPSVPLDRTVAAVVASIPQARELRDQARSFGIPINTPFKDKMVIAAEDGARTVKFGKLKLSIVGPPAVRVDKLQTKWDNYIQEKGLAQKDEAAAHAAEYLDRSVYNLASIVVLAEVGDKRMLLTGDARGDDILKGLEAAKLLDVGGGMHVDLFKLPHHGSSRNAEIDLFRRVKADHYVVSGDGRHGNPEKQTLKMITDARGDDEYTIHLTYKKPLDAARFLQAQSKNRKNLKVVYRDTSALSLQVCLSSS